MVWISNFMGPLLLCARSSWHPRPALVKDILALRLWSLWSQQAADCPAGTQEEGTQLPHTHAKHTQLRDNYRHTHTQSRASQRLLGQQIQLHEPPTLSKARTHSRRASQRAACQEGECGRGCRNRSQGSAGAPPLTQRQVGCQGKEQKTSLDQPPRSGLLHRLDPQPENLPSRSIFSAEF